MENSSGSYGHVAKTISSLPFVQAHGIEIVSMDHGRATARVAYEERFSTPPGLFPASMVGMLGDVAAIAACTAAVAPNACATLDFTVKMLTAAAGKWLEAEGTALQAGSTTAVGKADIYSVSENGERALCATVLATGRVVRARS